MLSPLCHHCTPDFALVPYFNQFKHSNSTSLTTVIQEYTKIRLKETMKKKKHLATFLCSFPKTCKTLLRISVLLSYVHGFFYRSYSIGLLLVPSNLQSNCLHPMKLKCVTSCNQISRSSCSTSEWTLWCPFKPEKHAKDLLHRLQWYGRSPVCVRV